LRWLVEPIRDAETEIWAALVARAQAEVNETVETGADDAERFRRTNHSGSCSPDGAVL
jgi:hypothetical protein